MGLHIVNEANKCLQCKKPLCSMHCPVTTSIPQVISLFKEGKIMEAGEILFENNPLSLVCSIVCDHEAQCLGNCIMNRKNNPVRFCDIERFISDFYLDRMEFVKKPRKNIMVAVIGGGPAGMTVAIKMIKEGYDVTIFDEKNSIGGVLQYGIPDFRLPKSLMKRYYDKMEEIGIITGSTLTVDYNRLGYTFIAYVGIFLERNHQAQFVLERLEEIPFVTVAHITSGKYNIFCKIRAKDTKHAKEVIYMIDDIQGVARSETMISMEEAINDKRRLLHKAFREL